MNIKRDYKSWDTLFIFLQISELNLLFPFKYVFIKNKDDLFYFLKFPNKFKCLFFKKNFDKLVWMNLKFTLDLKHYFCT